MQADRVAQLRQFRALARRRADAARLRKGLISFHSTGFKAARAPDTPEMEKEYFLQYRLVRSALFQTEIDTADWDDDARRWQVRTSRGDQLSARFLVTAGGILHKAKLPGIPGIEDYRGRAFHTSRWDYSVTGGAPGQPMDQLADKRVGIIGTGATAVQVVPQLGRSAEEVFVFQRTPSAVGQRDNGPTDEAWYRSQAPGWHAERVRNFTQAVTGRKPAQDLVGDGWTKVMWEDTQTEVEQLGNASLLFL
jgi:cation diffusion facilitator CzcD-associated flavoprotein CzcO